MSCRPIYHDVREVGKNIKSYQGAFNFPFTIGRNSLSIVQHGDRFELRINNQSFQHLYDAKLTQTHFKQDSFAGQSRAKSGTADRANAPANDEEDDLRKAIELSKQTAAREERERQKKEQMIRGSQPVKKNPAMSSDKNDDFDIGAGFEKFATYQKQGANRVDDIGDFDFGSVVKEEQKRDDFQFNFDGSATKSQSKQPEPDLLLDLLSGPSVSQPSQPQSNNALDFFNGNMGVLETKAHQAQASQQFNFGGQPAQQNFNQISDPFSAGNQVSQSQQSTQAEKPKFVPNPMFLSQQLVQNQPVGFMPQGQMGYQQQAYGTHMMMGAQQPGYMGGQFQTGFGAGQQYGTAMPAYSQGYQQNNLGGVQNQGMSPFDAFGQTSEQNGQQYGATHNNQQSTKQSTPFDMF